jgi:outer membrane protein assembly factor BamB
MYYRDSGGEVFVLDCDGSPTYGNNLSPGELNQGCSRLSMAPNGTLYTFKRITGGLCAIGPDGSLIWVFEFENPGNTTITGPPSIAPNGIVYCVSTNDNLYAIWPNGTEAWNRTVEQMDYYSVTTLGHRGEVYVRGRAIDAFGPDGTHLWRYSEWGHYVGAVVVAQDGTVLAATASGMLIALDANGNMVWSHYTGGTIGSSPAIGPDGTVYIGSQNGQMHALDPDGNLLWTYDTLSNVTSSPTVSAEGTVYFSCRNGEFYAIRADGSLKWVYRSDDSLQTGFYTNYAEGTAPVIGPDGTVLFGCEGDVLFALGRNFTRGHPIPLIDDGPFDSPWPVHGGGIGNRGSCGGPVLVSGPEERWSYTVGTGSGSGSGATWSTDPVVGRDRQVLIGSGVTLLALTSDGELAWVHHLPDNIMGTVSVSSNGTIYYACADGTVESLDPRGRTRWSASFGEHRRYHPLALSGTGILYLLAEDGSSSVNDKAYLYAINHDSSLRWSLAIGSGGLSPPAVGPDGSVHFTTRMGLLYKVRPDGDVAWAHLFSHDGRSLWYYHNRAVSSEVVVGPDGTVYFAFLNRTHAVASDGTALWTFEAEGDYDPWFFAYPSMVAPALREDGSLIQGDLGGTLYCLSPEGQRLWAYELDSAIVQQPVVDADGKVFVIQEGTLSAFDADGTLGWNHTYFEGVVWGHTIEFDYLTVLISGGSETLYLMDSDGNLRALGAGSSGDGVLSNPVMMVPLLVMVAVLVLILWVGYRRSTKEPVPQPPARWMGPGPR